MGWKRFCSEVRGGGGGGQVAGLLALGYDRSSSNPAEVYSFYSVRLLEKNENT